MFGSFSNSVFVWFCKGIYKNLYELEIELYKIEV